MDKTIAIYDSPESLKAAELRRVAHPSRFCLGGGMFKSQTKLVPRFASFLRALTSEARPCHMPSLRDLAFKNQRYPALPRWANVVASRYARLVPHRAKLFRVAARDLGVRARTEMRRDARLWLIDPASVTKSRT